MIQKLLNLGNRYAKNSDGRDFALTKFCLFSMGLIVGTKVAERYKKPVIRTACAVFAATYIPLMAKLFRLAVKNDT